MLEGSYRFWNPPQEIIDLGFVAYQQGTPPVYTLMFASEALRDKAIGLAEGRFRYETADHPFRDETYAATDLDAMSNSSAQLLRGKLMFYTHHHDSVLNANWLRVDGNYASDMEKSDDAYGHMQFVLKRVVPPAAVRPFSPHIANPELQWACEEPTRDEGLRAVRVNVPRSREWLFETIEDPSTLDGLNKAAKAVMDKWMLRCLQMKDRHDCLSVLAPSRIYLVKEYRGTKPVYALRVSLIYYAGNSLNEEEAAAYCTQWNYPGRDERPLQHQWLDRRQGGFLRTYEALKKADEECALDMLGIGPRATDVPVKVVTEKLVKKMEEKHDAQEE